MNVTILTSSTKHPIYNSLVDWQKSQSKDHSVKIVTDETLLDGGDMLVLISWGKILKPSQIARYKYPLLLHASDLPQDRGWSPHIWQILEGAKSIVVTLLEIDEELDAGDIWQQITIEMEGHELFDEINHKIFQAELDLVNFAIANATQITPQKQVDSGATYRPKRTPADSEIDVNQSIAAQFDLMRTADPERFPSFFIFRGHRYNIYLEKIAAKDEYEKE